MLYVNFFNQINLLEESNKHVIKTSQWAGSHEHCSTTGQPIRASLAIEVIHHGVWHGWMSAFDQVHTHPSPTQH